MRATPYAILLLLLSLCASAQQVPSANDAILKIQQISNDSVRIDSMYHYLNSIADSHPKEVVDNGKTLLQDAETHAYQRGIANANLLIGEGYEYMSDYAQSLKYYLRALVIYKERNIPDMQIVATLGVSRVYEVTNDMPNEKKYVEEAMAICEAYKGNRRVRRQQPGVLDYMATIYKKENRLDTSIKLYNEAVALARKDGDSNEVMNSLCNLATALKSNKNFDESLAIYSHVLTLIDSVNESYAFAIIIDDMSILFYQMGDLKRSEQYALKSLASAQKAKNLDVYKDVYGTLGKIYQKEKRYPEMLEYYEKLSDIKDTIFDREKLQQVTEWQTKFDTEAKDKEIQDQEKQLAYNRKINISLVVSSALFLLLGLIIYRNYKMQKVSNALLSKEKKRSEDLLLNILPTEVADELKDKGAADAKYFDNVTVLFTDFVNFTKASERMSPQKLIDELHFCFKAFDEIIDKYNIEKIKTIGDSYLAVSGLPVTDPMHAENITRAAIEINKFVLNRRQQMGDGTFEVRIGIHSGSVVAGIVGVKKFSYDIWGDTVNTAARMEQNSEAGKINISQTTYELVKDKFTCTYRGEIEAKNKGLMKMYFVSES